VSRCRSIDRTLKTRDHKKLAQWQTLCLVLSGKTRVPRVDVKESYCTSWAHDFGQTYYYCKNFRRLGMTSS